MTSNLDWLTLFQSPGCFLFDKLYQESCQHPFEIIGKPCCCALGVVDEVDTTRINGMKKTVCLMMTLSWFPTRASKNQVKANTGSFGSLTWALTSLSRYLDILLLRTFSHEKLKNSPDCPCMHNVWYQCVLNVLKPGYPEQYFKCLSSFTAQSTDKNTKGKKMHPLRNTCNITHTVNDMKWL